MHAHKQQLTELTHTHTAPHARSHARMHTHTILPVDLSNLFRHFRCNGVRRATLDNH